MCTVITLHQPGHAWPLLLAANRDELLDRAWDPPGAYWPGITGGRDRTGGGTWMAVNRAGVVAAVLNRPGSLGPSPGKRSRGELPLLALGHETADAAAGAMARLPGRDYRSFSLLLADQSAVWWLRNDDAGEITATCLPPGLHMTTAHDPDDLASPRVARHRPRFQAASPPVPPDWGDWPGLLADSAAPRAAALTVPPAAGFGTVCASLLAVPAAGPPTWLFAPGPAGLTRFAPVTLA